MYNNLQKPQNVVITSTKKKKKWHFVGATKAQSPLVFSLEPLLPIVDRGHENSYKED